MGPVYALTSSKPFQMLAGELYNSSASGVGYVERLWPKLKGLGLITVLAPVSWELVEPSEDRFDFTMVDTLLAQARKHDQRLVLLSFGSWKNGVSGFAPACVLKDTTRFRLAKGASDRTTKKFLSALSASNCGADSIAFARLMSLPRPKARPTCRASTDMAGRRPRDR